MIFIEDIAFAVVYNMLSLRSTICIVVPFMIAQSNSILFFLAIQNMKKEIHTRGPVAVTINASPLKAFTGGKVFDDDNESKMANHVGESFYT